MGDCPRLPLRSGSLDAIVLVFSAHEIRDREQRAGLFDEFGRPLAPGGRVILVKHLRDWANVAAFGPGAWHFQTRRTWMAVAERVGFGLIHEVHKTHFVGGWALAPS
ncbi:MAG: class I SAM-dependent methyltransferase [Actinomycetota bacterium]|nr:class I SAM-dependent methyltransferase [Actinomycetota bacterium]